MKNTGVCPKCKSTKIDAVKSDSFGNRVNTGAFSLASANYIVCCECGYDEEWTGEKIDLKKPVKRNA